MLASRLHRRRGVLIGEPVIDAIRLEVGPESLLEDVEPLQAVNKGGSAQTIAQRYSVSRWLDVLQVGLATDLLVRLFSNRNPLLLPLRKIALGLLSAIPAMRQLSLQAMSDGPMQLWRPLPD